MRTTIDMPDAMYRRIRTRTAQEGMTVRGISEDDAISFSDGFAAVVDLPNLAKANPGFLDRLPAVEVVE